MLLSNKQLPLLKLHEEIQNKILTDKQINYKLAYCKVNCISNVVKLRLILILFWTYALFQVSVIEDFSFNK